MRGIEAEVSKETTPHEEAGDRVKKRDKTTENANGNREEMPLSRSEVVTSVEVVF